MKKWDRLAALVLAAVGIGAAVMAFLMGLGTFSNPGPGFFPFWLALFLTAIALLIFLGQLGRDTESAPLWTGRSWLRPALAISIMLAFALCLNWFGFFPATFLLFVIWLLVEGEKPVTIGSVAVFGTAGVYLLFTKLLQVPLPEGRLFR